MTNKDALVDRIIIVVVVVWVTAIAYSMTDHEYQVPDALHLLMSALVTILIGGKKLPKKDKDENDYN